jgi:hypothetical protein
MRSCFWPRTRARSPPAACSAVARAAWLARARSAAPAAAPPALELALQPNRLVGIWGHAAKFSWIPASPAQYGGGWAEHSVPPNDTGFLRVGLLTLVCTDRRAIYRPGL